MTAPETTTAAVHDRRPVVEKVVGGDVELANFVPGRAGRSGAAASRALLREVRGVAARHATLSPCACGGCVARRQAAELEDGDGDPQDWGRKYLRENGGCVYVDLDHLELAMPEVTSAREHLACWLGMLEHARWAQARANARRAPKDRIEVLVNNSDGRGNSYGSHLNVLVTRRCFDDLFGRKLHHLAVLASHQVSSLVVAGQGKVGAENGAPPVAYQLSQRADFFERVVGLETTARRPLVNARDEPLCGEPRRTSPALARLHVIFYDSNLCHVAHVLKVGTLQVVVAMLEAGTCDPDLALDDPLEAVVRFSHDPTLKARARLASGDKVTAVEHQRRVLEAACAFAAQGGLDGVVPGWRELLALWEDTLDRLDAVDLAALAPRLDWVAKLAVIERALARRPGLDLASREAKVLDLLYARLDREGGLFWAREEAGLVERLASPADVERLVHTPPEGTRAWTRAHLLRRAGPDEVLDVDWDHVRFALGDGARVVVHLPDPRRHTRAEVEPLLRDAVTLADAVAPLQGGAGVA